MLDGPCFCIDPDDHPDPDDHDSLDELLTALRALLGAPLGRGAIARDGSGLARSWLGVALGRVHDALRDGLQKTGDDS